MRSNVIPGRGAPTCNVDPIGGEIIQATAAVMGATSREYAFDVNSYVNAQRAAGHDVVSFMIQAGAVTSSSIIDFNSKEASSGKPALVLSESGPSLATPAAASPSTVTGATTSLSVLGADPAGESSLTYTWYTVSQPTGGSLSVSATGTNAAKNVTAYFAKPGTYSMYALITDPSSNSISSNTLTFTVVATLASIAVTPTPVALNENATQQFAASGLDQFGVALASQPTFTWSNSGVGSVNSTGLYTAPGTTGSATVTATSGSVSGNASVTVGNAAPTVATAASASPSPVTGTTTALSALGADDGGESNLTYTWTTTSIPSGATAPTYSANGTNAAKSDTATFTSAGDYTFQVTITDLGSLYVTSSVSVTVNQELTNIDVTPKPVVLGSDGTQQFAASGLDQFGVAMASQPTFTWTNSGSGSVDSTGLYTAPAAAGSDTVTATSGSVSGGTSITIGGPSVATAASASVIAAPGIVALSALGSDPDGESTLSYAWTLTSSPAGSAVTFGENGDNGASTAIINVDTAGTYAFQVTISDGTNSVTSEADMTISQVLTGISPSQVSAALNNGDGVGFSATAYDQFGNPMATQPTLSWSASSGSVDSDGNYVAPSSGGGPDTVTASADGVTASATIEYGEYVGTVTDSSGDALGGWSVYLDENGNGVQDDGEPSTTTDADGSFTLPNFCGGMCGSPAVVVVPDAGWSFSCGGGSLPVVAGAAAANLNFAPVASVRELSFDYSNYPAIAGEQVTAVITDLTDLAPVASDPLTIQVTNSGGHIVDSPTIFGGGTIRTNTTGAGTYRLICRPMEPGTYTITATTADGTHASATLTVEAAKIVPAAGQAATVNINTSTAPTSASITYEVVGATTGRAAHAGVSVSGSVGDGSYIPDGDAIQTTDSSGTVTFPVNALLPDGGTGVLKAETLASGSTDPTPVKVVTTIR